MRHKSSNIVYYSTISAMVATNSPHNSIVLTTNLWINAHKTEWQSFRRLNNILALGCHIFHTQMRYQRHTMILCYWIERVKKYYRKRHIYTSFAHIYETTLKRLMQLPLAEYSCPELPTHSQHSEHSRWLRSIRKSFRTWFEWKWRLMNMTEHHTNVVNFWIVPSHRQNMVPMQHEKKTQLNKGVAKRYLRCERERLPFEKLNSL